MPKDKIIDIVVETLSKYPEVRFQKNSDNEVEIFCNDENGFDILLQTDQRENTLHFGAFHWHFENNEEETTELLDQLLLGLTGLARLKEFSKSGKAFKWVLQVQDAEGNWHDNGTMALMNFSFWARTRIRYLQNRILSISILYQGGSTDD